LQQALPHQIAGNFPAGGLHFDIPTVPSPPHDVLEPHSLPLLALVLAGLATMAGRRRRAVAACRPPG
jgi:hypothetical protein